MAGATDGRAGGGVTGWVDLLSVSLAWDNYPDSGYYDYSQPYATQTWCYYSDPAGYYLYVTQCDTAWQPVPAS
jgi:hypothetical protein